MFPLRSIDNHFILLCDHIELLHNSVLLHLRPDSDPGLHSGHWLPMDVFSATLCSAQALAYALSVIKSLIECHLALRHGCDFLCDQQASVGHLLEVLIQLKHRTRLDPPLKSLLESIDTTVRDILLLVKQRKRRQLLILLVIRRTEVNESFALLERKKSTLNLYLTTENSFAIASLKTVILRHSTRDLEMADPRQNHLEVCVRT